MIMLRNDYTFGHSAADRVVYHPDELPVATQAHMLKSAVTAAARNARREANERIHRMPGDLRRLREACSDEIDQCDKTQCAANPVHMLDKCSLTCGYCADNCVDLSEQCATWAASGAC